MKSVVFSSVVALAYLDPQPGAQHIASHYLDDIHKAAWKRVYVCLLYSFSDCFMWPARLKGNSTLCTWPWLA